MSKLRFGLRLMLALPACVTAFYLGWRTHSSHIQFKHQRDTAIAQQRSVEILRELSRLRSIRATELLGEIEALEHHERMQSYERMLRDPIGAKMLPSATW